MTKPGHPFNPRHSRRTLLRSLGLAAATSPFIPLLNASGQENVFPKRLVLFFTPHGTVLDAWRPSGSETDFTFKRILAPLERHKQKLVLVNGLSIPNKGVGAPHTKGIVLLWSGSTLLDDGTFIRPDDAGGPTFGWNSSPSVDQVIAKVAGTATAYKSLEFGVRCLGSRPNTRMIYSAPKQPLPPRDDPYAAFGSLFANLTTDGPRMMDRLTAERRSSIDIVKAELDSLQSRASAADRAKIDAHLTSLRSIETRLTMPASARVCTPRMLGTKIDARAVANTPAIFDRGLDVLAASLACDLTRVASFQHSIGDNDGIVYSWLGAPEHHITSHAGDNDGAAREQLTKIYTWFSERFAYLLDRLDSVVEGNGTMLDNTLVVWGSEVGKGNTHSYSSVPFVLAGGLSGAIKTGRYLSYPGGTIHNRLLVSICQLMGLSEVQTFGNTDTGSGPLPNLV